MGLLEREKAKQQRSSRIARELDKRVRARAVGTQNGNTGSEVHGDAPFQPGLPSRTATERPSVGGSPAFAVGTSSRPVASTTDLTKELTDKLGWAVGSTLKVPYSPTSPVGRWARRLAPKVVENWAGVAPKP